MRIRVELDHEAIVMDLMDARIGDVVRCIRSLTPRQGARLVGPLGIAIGLAGNFDYRADTGYSSRDQVDATIRADYAGCDIWIEIPNHEFCVRSDGSIEHTHCDSDVYWDYFH